MKMDITTTAGAVIGGLVISIILFSVWLTRKIKQKKSESRLQEGKLYYSNSQRAGIFLIILLLVPFLYLTLGSLAKGALFLYFFIFSQLSLPAWLDMVLESLALSGAYFLIFAGTFSICELIWPRKKTEKVNNI